MPTVPHGTTDRQMERALRAFEAALGEGSVLTEPSDLLEFRDPYWSRGSEDFDSAAALLPSSIKEVQAVMRIANEHQVPVWASSQGRNYGYGGAAPRMPGTIALSLRELDTIEHIDDELAYAVVQPGVRFMDLHAALTEADSNLWCSVPDLGWGSVLANALECGTGYMPFGDHASHLCGLEVVLPTGELVRTGPGAMAQTPSWHVYPHDFGPSVRGLFQQSNLGVVVRAGVWLMPRPEVFAIGEFSFEGYQKLSAVVDALRSLMLDGTVNSHPVLSRGIGVDDSGTLSIDPASESWSCALALYGREEVVNLDLPFVAEKLHRAGASTVEWHSFEGNRQGMLSDHHVNVWCGVPDLTMLEPEGLPYGANTAHADIKPVGPCRGDDVVKAEQVIRGLYAKHDLAYANGLYLNPRSVLHASTVLYDSRQVDQVQEAFAVQSEVVVEMGKLGYGLYRAHQAMMDLAAEQFSQGDHALMRLHETLKDAIDPRGILAPGKQGVWPRHLRHSKEAEHTVVGEPTLTETREGAI